MNVVRMGWTGAAFFYGAISLALRKPDARVVDPPIFKARKLKHEPQYSRVPVRLADFDHL